MGTEITKSKISQELRDRAALLNLDVRHWQQVKFLNKSADAIDELNQHLSEQTASGMERGKKDQEEIKRLNRELEEVRKEAQDFAEGLLACRAGVSAAAQEKDKDVKMRKVENFTALMESLWMKAQYFIAKYPQKEGA